MPQRVEWRPWDDDPIAKATGVSFNREPVAEPIRAPPSRMRVCAWHIDFDERPVCYVDVASLAEARAIAENLASNCRYNVDFASVHDDRGALVYSGRPW